MKKLICLFLLLNACNVTQLDSESESTPDVDNDLGQVPFDNFEEKDSYNPCIAKGNDKGIIVYIECNQQPIFDTSDPPPNKNLILEQKTLPSNEI